MKTSRIVVCILMLILTVCGWGGYLKNLGKDNKTYSDVLEEARSLAARELYVKSVQSYVSALNVQSSDEKVWQELVDTSRLAYEEGSYSWDNFANKLSLACSACPSNLEFWRELLNEMEINGYSSDAYDCAEAAIASGITDDEILDTAYRIIYDFRYSGSSYKEIVSSPEGIVAVSDGNYWGLLDNAGEPIYSLSYKYIAPYSSERQILLITDKWKHVVNENGIAQAVIFDDIKSSLAYGNGYVPLQDEDGSWYYFNCNDNSESERFTAVTSFADGNAAVKKDSAWEFVDTSLSPTGLTFDDIKLYENGAYAYAGIMVASKNGKYSVYNSDGSARNEFIADDMDLYMGDLIAYKASNGLWGYVSLEGDVVIEPQFEEAKSFSSGLGSVCREGMWGFINKTGRLVINYQFDDTKYFNETGSCFVDSGGWQMIKFNYR